MNFMMDFCCNYCRQEQQEEVKQPAEKQPENSSNGEPIVKV